MTHSDKAWAVINELRETWCYGPCNYQEGCGCSDAIAAAIRGAELAAYEKAAKVAEDVFANDTSVYPEGPSVEDIATAIRHLKDKGT